MEARGYAGGRGRTYLIRLHMRPADWIALVLVLTISLTPFLVDPGPLEGAVVTWLRAHFE